MIIKFVTLPETCKPDKQSWADVSNLLKNKIEAKFGDQVDFRHIEFMSENWFKDLELCELADKIEMKYPIILINNEIFSNGDKINISKLIGMINKMLE